MDLSNWTTVRFRPVRRSARMRPALCVRAGRVRGRTPV